MTYENYLYHHGIKGQKWGIRRFQNEDGSYTEAGKKNRRHAYYQDYQYEHDKELYGKKAAKRIAEKRNEQDVDLIAARHAEVVRKEKIQKGKSIAKKAIAATAKLTTAFVIARHPEWIEKAQNAAFDKMDKVVKLVG